MTASTMERLERRVLSARVDEPAWPVALLFPWQGHWTEEDYFALDTNRLVELSDGCLEVLPLPTPFHQLIAQFLFSLLQEFVAARKLGLVFIAAMPVRLWPEKIREPDVFFLRPGRLVDREGPALGADLAMEVVSKGKEDRKRDLIIKRSEYARAGIPEYWIVDPETKRITLLVLEGKKYRLHAEFGPGSRVASVVLPGFEVDVDAVFAVEAMLPPSKKPQRRTSSSKRKPKQDR
jgi:Uma2 family endonuclease